MDDVFKRLTRALKSGGILYVSFKHGTGQTFRNGRLFNDYTEPALRAFLANHPLLEIINLWITQDIRPTRTEIWLNGLIRKKTNLN